MGFLCGAILIGKANVEIVHQPGAGRWSGRHVCVELWGLLNAYMLSVKGDDLIMRQLAEHKWLGNPLPKTKGRTKARDREGDAAPHPDDRAAWERRIEAQVMEAEVVLTAVLHRFDRSIAEVLDFAPGDLLTLPESAIGRLRLETGDGTAVSGGRLGQSAGLRAVRLTEQGTEGAAGWRGAAGCMGLSCGFCPARERSEATTLSAPASHSG